MSRKLSIQLNSEENKLVTFVATELMRQGTVDRSKAVKFLALRKAAEYYNQWVETQKNAAKESVKNEQQQGEPSSDSESAQSRSDADSATLADQESN